MRGLDFGWLALGSSNQVALQKLFKFFGSKTCILGNLTHGKGINRVVAWKLHDPNSVAHCDMLSLTN
jgi:hypothetical protein